MGARLCGDRQQNKEEGAIKQHAYGPNPNPNPNPNLCDGGTSVTS